MWTRSALTWKEKLHIFESLVLSKLLFSLVGVVLNKAQERKLNGFQNRCLRKIIGMKPAFVSRVSNATVLQRCSCYTATHMLRVRRFQLLGKILRAPSGHPLRDACFIPGTWVPATDRYVRRVGRPAREWIKEVMREAVVAYGSWDAVLADSQNKPSWKQSVTRKIASQSESLFK